MESDERHHSTGSSTTSTTQHVQSPAALAATAAELSLASPVPESSKPSISSIASSSKEPSDSARDSALSLSTDAAITSSDTQRKGEGSVKPVERGDSPKRVTEAAATGNDAPLSTKSELRSSPSKPDPQ